MQPKKEAPGSALVVLAPAEAALVPSASSAEALAALQMWDGMAKKAYSENTRRAQKADAAIFQAFC